MLLPELTHRPHSTARAHVYARRPGRYVAANDLKNSTEDHDIDPADPRPRRPSRSCPTPRDDVRSDLRAGHHGLAVLFVVAEEVDIKDGQLPEAIAAARSNSQVLPVNIQPKKIELRPPSSSRTLLLTSQPAASQQASQQASKPAKPAGN